MATFYVDDATGDDLDDGSTEALAFKTLQKAMDTVAANDKVWAKNTNTYTEAVSITTAGGATTPIVFEGYTSSIGDGGVFIIDGENTRANGLTNSASTTVRYVFKNLRVINHTAVGISLPTSHNLVFKSCQADGNGGVGGVDVDNRCIFIDCTFNGNTGTGVTAGDYATFIGCRSYDNSVHGFNMESGFCVHCVTWSNASNNFYSPGVLGPVVIVNCTGDGESKDTTIGIQVSNNIPTAVVNCIIYDNTTGFDAGDVGEMLVSRNNLVNSNTANYVNGGQTFSGEVTAAPGFENEATHDYRLASGSAARGVGFDGNDVQGQSAAADIGGQQAAAGAGGGLLTHPGWGGGFRG